MTQSGDAFQGYPEKLTVKEITVTDGVVTLKETTTPTAVTDYGKFILKTITSFIFRMVLEQSMKSHLFRRMYGTI
jgi:hypothetical protein